MALDFEIELLLFWLLFNITNINIYVPFCIDTPIRCQSFQVLYSNKWSWTLLWFILKHSETYIIKFMYLWKYDQPKIRMGHVEIPTLFVFNINCRHWTFPSALFTDTVLHCIVQLVFCEETTTSLFLGSCFLAQKRWDASWRNFVWFKQFPTK